MIHENAVIIVTRLWGGQYHCTNPGRKNRISLFERVQNGSRAHPAFYYQDSFAGLQYPEDEVDPLTPKLCPN